MSQFEKIIMLKHQNFVLLGSEWKILGGGCILTYGAVIRNADIQKWSESILCLAVDLVVSLFDAASLFEHVTFRDNIVIIFYFPFFCTTSWQYLGCY
jgi:hypothetical protein